MPAINVSVSHAPAGRLQQLDELKGLAILLILLYHAGGVLVWRNYLHGDLGVDIFLLLSGIGLTLSRRTESFKDFGKRRLLRLMPGYWAVLLLYLLANTHFLQHHYSAGNIAAHVAGVHGLWGDRFGLAINDSFWFITAILVLYVAFWLTRDLLEHLDRFLLVAGAMSAGLALVFYFANQPGMMGHLGLRAPSFFFGMIIGRTLKIGRIEVPTTWQAALGLLLLLYVPYTQGIIFMSGIVSLAVVAGYAWWIRPALEPEGRIVHGLKFLGDHSLEIFLIHQPLIRDYNYYLHGRWLQTVNPSPLSLGIGMLLALALTLLLSIELRRFQAFLFKHARRPDWK
jgi:peptidoglycan/LPS O-acetylase OafA/YrhL